MREMPLSTQVVPGNVRQPADTALGNRSIRLSGKFTGAIRASGRSYRASRKVVDEQAMKMLI